MGRQRATRQRQATAPPQRTPGRNLALTPDIHERLIQNIAAGIPLEHSARAAGIHPATYFRWIARAEEAEARAEAGHQLDPDDLRLCDFREAALRARAESVAMNVIQIQKAAQGGYLLKKTTRTYRQAGTGELVTEVEETYAPIEWRAALEMLKRRDRKNFAQATLTPEEAAAAAATGDDGDMSGADAAVTPAEVTELAGRMLDNIARAVAERADRSGPAELESGGGQVIAGEVVSP